MISGDRPVRVVVHGTSRCYWARQRLANAGRYTSLSYTVLAPESTVPAPNHAVSVLNCAVPVFIKLVEHGIDANSELFKFECEFHVIHYVSCAHKWNITQAEGVALPTYTAPGIVDGVKVYPGVKDLPAHLRQNFRNEFIRFVIKHVANSESPWANPDVNSLQSMYQVVYPMFPAQLSHCDAVCHPVRWTLPHVHITPHSVQTITSLGVLRNHIASAALDAVKRHLSKVWSSKRLNSIEARAGYINSLFLSDNEHPMIWREYVEGNIQAHPEIGGYQTVRKSLVPCHVSR